ncbi:glutathione S-transferase [Candidatus Gracilibacteria bacterium]|nr:glutathione S-transferase [Candidatus Gracilibacteria bacterium]
MIDLYTLTTPNGRKVSIALEEMGLPYNVHKIDITKGEQFTPEYIAINPNSKIPAIIDRDEEITVFESGAISIYLAEKTNRFFSTERKQKYQSLEWLMFQMASVGPMFGQYNHFNRFALEKIPYAIAPGNLHSRTIMKFRGNPAQFYLFGDGDNGCDRRQ